VSGKRLLRASARRKRTRTLLTSSGYIWSYATKTAESARPAYRPKMSALPDDSTLPASLACVVAQRVADAAGADADAAAARASTAAAARRSDMGAAAAAGVAPCGSGVVLLCSAGERSGEESGAGAREREREREGFVLFVPSAAPGRANAGRACARALAPHAQAYTSCVPRAAAAGVGTHARARERKDTRNRPRAH
jgi:hypothetical protein